MELPSVPIAAMCGLVLASVAAVALVRLDAPAAGAAAIDSPAGVVASSELRFLDRPDGSIAVVDARSGRTVDRVVGEAGFVRGTLRGLARERKRQGIGPDAEFRLVARVDGRLTLLDPATRRKVDLESFGPVNAAEFARMLSAATAPQHQSAAVAPHGS